LNSQQEFIARDYFDQKVCPKLMPIMIDQIEKLPDLREHLIYLAVQLSKREDPDAHSHALIEIPTDTLPRFFILPRTRNKQFIILLDALIRLGLPDIFSVFPFDRIQAYTIKLTRDAELDIEDDLYQSYIKKVSKSVKQREEGVPVRFIYDSRIPAQLLSFITTKLKLGEGDTLVPAGKYHNYKDFMDFPDLGRDHLKYAPIKFLSHRDLERESSSFKALRKKDVLLHYPYQSFQYVLDRLRDASIDPKVKSIKITLYRVAKNSAVVNALINAVRNGKKVIANMQLQARFDEEANIHWANRLQEEGARVRFGVPGLKVHCKLCLITREERNGAVQYGIIGMGNLNEATAKIYSDHHLLTADKRLTREMGLVFDFFENNYKNPHFKHLLVSPFNTRKRILRLILNETNNIKEGRDAYNILKMNNLVDTSIIRRLYEASEAGVPIALQVRSMFSLVPQVPQLSSSIRACGIVDKFLEHSRILVFCNGGEEKHYITSADLMPRNLDRRVDVTCPVYDPEIQQEIRSFLELQCRDNVKARIRDRDLLNKLHADAATEKNRSQWRIYDYLKELNSPEQQMTG
jgi:polyphosphate kinase